MRIIDTLANVDLKDLANVAVYWNSDLVDALYFGPKKVMPGTRDTALADPSFLQRLQEVASFAGPSSLAAHCEQLLSGFGQNTGFSAGDQTLYLVLGCATTTIYTVALEGEEVSVLCVESLRGSDQTLAMYLAHEYTHFVRKELLNKDIFESCVGERLVTEGIAESFSKDVVPNATDADCCIVDASTVRWVDEHWDDLNAYVRAGLESTELMEPLFYMFAKIDFPVRTGYVYGYFAVRDYLKRHHLQTKDIIGIDWQSVLASDSL